MLATLESPADISDEVLDAPELSTVLDQLEQAYFTFQPRPDQPERYDEQESFLNSKTTGVAWMIGGNGAGTTEVALHKVAKFVLNDQPPPRADTPFWIISGSYEQVMETAWKEKLNGHGHIPGSEVDWDRISWYRPNKNWPFSVPLKPWPGRPGRNWVLEFKSYEQGRQQMQARSIGGFCFSEQFPWGLLEEVLRGCREYNFAGSKMCEFTPVDPNLSIEIEEMIEEDSLPPGWELYRANAECAKEAGHVRAEWFDEFFAMIPDEMLETRLTGRFPTYEGAIYQGFNPALHLVDDDVIDFPPNIFHRRGIDWGSGPENAFSCEWAYRNGKGQWFVYDEYYSTDQSMTTVDHLVEVWRRWPWPRNNPHYGATWADPSSPDDIRIASKLSQYAPGVEPISISGAANAVLEGIEHVQYLLKPAVGLGGPRLFIHKHNCPKLAREMRTYRWKRSSEIGLNPQDAPREPLKKNDHAVDGLRYLVFSEATHSGITPSSMRREDRSRQRGVRLARR